MVSVGVLLRFFLFFNCMLWLSALGLEWKFVSFFSGLFTSLYIISVLTLMNYRSNNVSM